MGRISSREAVVAESKMVRNTLACAYAAAKHYLVDQVGLDWAELNWAGLGWLHSTVTKADMGWMGQNQPSHTPFRLGNGHRRLSPLQVVVVVVVAVVVVVEQHWAAPSSPASPPPSPALPPPLHSQPMCLPPRSGSGVECTQLSTAATSTTSATPIEEDGEEMEGALYSTLTVYAFPPPSLLPFLSPLLLPLLLPLLHLLLLLLSLGKVFDEGSRSRKRGRVHSTPPSPYMP